MSVASIVCVKHFLLSLQQDFQQRLPDDDFYNGFVTWSALEDALNGLRQEYDSLSQGSAATHEVLPSSGVEKTDEKKVIKEHRIEKELVEVGNQTDDVRNDSNETAEVSYLLNYICFQ